MCLRTLYFINKCDYNVYLETLFFYSSSCCSAEIKQLKMGSITLQLFHFQILLKILHLSNKCDDDIFSNLSKASIYCKKWKSLIIRNVYPIAYHVFMVLKEIYKQKHFLPKCHESDFKNPNIDYRWTQNCHIVMFLNHNYRIVRVVF